MELLVFRCQTRPSPIAILEQPFQGRRHTARLVKDQAQILERLRHRKMGAANVPRVRDSRRCPIEDDNFSLGGADGEAHALAEVLRAITKLRALIQAAATLKIPEGTWHLASGTIPDSILSQWQFLQNIVHNTRSTVVYDNVPNVSVPDSLQAVQKVTECEFMGPCLEVAAAQT